MPLKSVRSFVADNTRATYGEDGGRASRCPWVDVLRLRYTAALLHGWAAEIYVLAQHNSGSQSPVAMVQARSYAWAKHGMLAVEKGCVPFREWLGGHFRLMWCGVLAADPSAVLEAYYSGAHVFVSGVPAGLSAAWVRCVESGQVSPQSLSTTFQLSTAPHYHVEPEPVFTCHFCWCPCVSWGATCGMSVQVRYGGPAMRLPLLLPCSRAMVVCGTHPTTTRCTEAIAW